MLTSIDDLYKNDVINIYYAGLDHHGLPFDESNKLIRKTLSIQGTYLKALALIADNIIVPPSFYFYLAYQIKTHLGAKGFDVYKDLYQAGIITSAIYQHMNSSTDFIEHKMQTGTASDKIFILSAQRELKELFQEIPLVHRDTKQQSSGFSEKLIENINKQRNFTDLDRDVLELINAYYLNTILERETIFDLLHTQQYQYKSSKYRNIYYATNKAYYQQGAVTYNAVISLLHAERYSIFQLDAYSQNRSSILIAYDPSVVLYLFSLFNITGEMITQLTIEDLIKIRSSFIFREFKKEYYNFALQLQGLSKVSRPELIKLKEKIISEFSQQVNKPSKAIFYEQISYTSVLGIAGYFVSPLLTMFLGFVTNVLNKKEISVSNYILEMVHSRSTIFRSYIHKVQKSIEQIEV